MNPLDRRLDRLIRQAKRDGKMRMELVSRAGECILTAGAGMQVPHRVSLADSQLAFVRWFGTQLDASANLSRAFMIDDRRGGKTWAGLLCLVALTIERPGQTSYVISHPGQRDAEISEFFERFVPSSWFDKSYGTNPEYAFGRSRIINWSTKRLADVPSRGACLMVNDYTMLKERAFDALMDFQGMVIVAGTPPFEAKDRWFEKYKAKFRDGSFRVFRVPPRENQYISQDARERIDRLLELTNPGSTTISESFWSSINPSEELTK